MQIRMLALCMLCVYPARMCGMDTILDTNDSQHTSDAKIWVHWDNERKAYTYKSVAKHGPNQKENFAQQLEAVDKARRDKQVAAQSSSSQSCVSYSSVDTRSPLPWLVASYQLVNDNKSRIDVIYFLQQSIAHHKQKKFDVASQYLYNVRRSLLNMPESVKCKIRNDFFLIPEYKNYLYRDICLTRYRIEKLNMQEEATLDIKRTYRMHFYSVLALLYNDRPKVY